MEINFKYLFFVEQPSFMHIYHNMTFLHDSQRGVYVCMCVYYAMPRAQTVVENSIASSRNKTRIILKHVSTANDLPMCLRIC